MDGQGASANQPMSVYTKPYWVYIVRCSDDTYYTGIAVDADARIEQHNAGKGAKYTRSRRPVTCVYREICIDKSVALRRELRIKSLTRHEKEGLIGRYALSLTVQQSPVESE